MQKIDLYRYEESNGMVTVTPNRRGEADIPSRMRLIADENCILTNGTKETPAVDVMPDEVDKWHEIGDADETTEVSNYEKIIDILSGEGE